jgi:phage virion morphogenesis protein
MADELTSLEEWMTPLLAALSERQRRDVARKIGQALRRSQASRIAAQKAPDGSAYQPRKPQQATTKARQQAGTIRRTMFAKLRTAKNLKVSVSDEGVAVGFLGRTARIARVHQEGLPDTVEKGGPTYRYPARQLLGFTQEDREAIRDLLLQHVTDLMP